VALAVIGLDPEGNLSRYLLQEIRKFPMLSYEEELSLPAVGVTTMTWRRRTNL
jgi:hypothetical protein